MKILDDTANLYLNRSQGQKPIYTDVLYVDMN